jgi:hypothetical protein
MPTTIEAPDMNIPEPVIGNFLPKLPAFNSPSSQLHQSDLPMPAMQNQPPAMQSALKEGFVNNPQCLLNMKPTWNIREYVKDNSNVRPMPSDYTVTTFEKANW